MIVIDIEKTGENIRRLIEENGLSQREFTKMIGVTREALTGWLSSEYLISVSCLLSISVVFGVPMADILSFTKEDSA